MDCGPLVEAGYANWDHMDGPAHLIGEPLSTDRTEIDAPGLGRVPATEGRIWLYTGHPEADAVWSLCKAQRGIPVPPVRWYDDDARWFGTAFCVVGFMPGERLVLGPRSFGPGEVRGLAPQAIGAMALLHSLEWRELAGVWGAPVSLRAELERLSGLLKRPRLEPEIAVLARRLGEQITARVPQEEDFRCVHGDFQWSNLLFDSGRLSAVLDWELAHLGQAPVDLGWLMLFSDVESWDGSDLVPQGAPGPRDLLELYNAHQERPRAFEELCWFRAFAAYRFAVITAFNLMLHRAGKRPDAKWEEIALSMPRLIRRAERLLRPAAS